jgi:hypothetical protein
MAEPMSGLMVEFASDEAIVEATRALTERGFRELDGFTPRPIEALQTLLAPQRSTLPRTVFVAGALGAATALATQWFCNAWDYPLNVGGRPAFSLPACIPITFELMVLFAAVAAFFGVLHRAGLPHLTHPVFDVPLFASASVDRFWLFVSTREASYQPDETERILHQHGCVSIVAIPPGGDEP